MPLPYKLQKSVDLKNGEVVSGKDSKLDPTPSIGAAGGEPSNDIKELLVFMRKSIQEMAYNNRPYTANGKHVTNPILKQLLDVVRSITGDLTKEHMNSVVTLFLKDPCKRLSPNSNQI